MRRARAVAGLGNRHRQNAILQIGGHASDVDRFGQREGAREAAVAALDAMKLLARRCRGRASATRAPRIDDAAVLGVDVDLIARQARAVRR